MSVLFLAWAAGSGFMLTQTLGDSGNGSGSGLLTVCNVYMCVYVLNNSNLILKNFNDGQLRRESKPISLLCFKDLSLCLKKR